MTLKSFRIALLAGALTWAGGAQALLVESGHWSSSFYTNNYPEGTNFAIRVDQTPDGDYTGVFMQYDQGLLTGITSNVDEGADLFVVQPGTEFSLASIAAGGQPFVYGPSGYEQGRPAGFQLPVGTDFYLGGRTRKSYSEFTVYGWAHFVVDAQGAPRIVDSAMAFDSGGIIVGTLDAIPAVPEPATWLMMGAGLAALAGVTMGRRRVSPRPALTPARP